MIRSISESLSKDLDSKIVLLSGPRQVGKTFLSKTLFDKNQAVYLNYDLNQDRRIILKGSWPRDKELVVLDEIHKKSNWKRWIKGIFDTEGVRPRLLLTGSARLHIFKKGGDSLAGRHFSYRLHPFSVAEISDKNPRQTVNELLKWGGFPEPYIQKSETFLRRWQISHLDRIIQEDLRDLKLIKEVKLVETLISLLSERVGSGVSYQSLSEDLGVSPVTIKSWIEMLEDLYVVFTIRPFSKNIAKAIKKEPKVYFYDQSRVQGDQGAKIENLVACHLKKHLDFLEDTQGIKSGLFYLKDKMKREVDFVIVQNSKLQSLVEVKLSDDQISSALQYYAGKLGPIESVQLVFDLHKEQQINKTRVLDLSKYLSRLST